MSQQTLDLSSRPQELQPIVTDSLDQLGRERVAHLGRDLTATDALGAVAGNNQPRYDGFGGERVASVDSLPTDFAFTGQKRDQSGLMYFGARYYDPALGTFISADSIVVRPGDPASLNRYTYSANNPMRYNDPTGHDISGVLHTLSDFGQGVAKQWGYDNAWLLPMTQQALAVQPDEPTAMTVGRHVGNVLAAVQGVAEFGAGGGAALGGGVLCLTGIGCIAGGEVAVAGGVVVAVHGGTTAINAAAQEGALLSDLYMMAKAPKGTSSGSGSSRGSQSRTQVRSDWSPASIGDPQYLNGCEGVAKQIKGIVGGDIKRIVPKRGQVLGGFGKSGQWAYGEWAYHEVVVRDGRVFDAFTGHEGMSIEQYKSLWRYADAVDFGF